MGLTINGQVNLVNNPSFEDYYDCNLPNYIAKAKYWNSIDTTKPGAAGDYFNVCYPNVPYTTSSFQYPKTGNGFILATFYCTSPTCVYPNFRTYPRNRLKNYLIGGKVYCVKMFVNLTNTSPNAIDALGVHFGDVTLDTIKYCMMKLTYLSNGVSNSAGIINDTLNWVEVSGTYTATGTEKYLVIGNFKTDAATNSTTTGVGGGVFSEYNIDDVSVIDYNLPAYAGPDKNINLGDSAFIGRPPEIGLECTWTTGTTTVGTGGGIWVKPLTLGTFSYVVTQNICGNIKTDTVNVNMSTGINENTLFAQSISIYPQPARDLVNISLSYFYDKSIEVKIFDVTGKEIDKKELEVTQGKAQIPTVNLSEGVYILQIINSDHQTAQKRLIIAR
ncbi:MAG TPA: T9SS type A sorting domain-containing protein [Bacteroidia bacterium]|nr:T9SS type A sorting domain-containing protein [Bacteroidia bacterium]